MYAVVLPPIPICFRTRVFPYLRKVNSFLALFPDTSVVSVRSTAVAFLESARYFPNRKVVLKFPKRVGARRESGFACHEATWRCEYQVVSLGSHAASRQNGGQSCQNKKPADQPFHIFSFVKSELVTRINLGTITESTVFQTAQLFASLSAHGPLEVLHSAEAPISGGIPDAS